MADIKNHYEILSFEDRRIELYSLDKQTKKRILM